MAKYNWHKFRKRLLYGVQTNTTYLFHYARCMGKTTELCKRALTSGDKNSMILCAHSGMRNNARTIIQELLQQAGVVFEYDRVVNRFLINDRSIYIETISTLPDRMLYYHFRNNTRDSLVYYIDNYEHVQDPGSNDEVFRSLEHLYNQGRIRGITFTGNNNDSGLNNLLKKILAENKELYYHKYHDENTINNYIDSNTFSSRADADAALCPRSLLAS